MTLQVPLIKRKGKKTALVQSDILLCSGVQRLGKEFAISEDLYGICETCVPAICIETVK